nr:non-ribosomal peptide synthetase [Gordonia sp. SID5947]
MAAALAPDRAALSGAAGPITFQTLQAQVAATAAVLADSGLDAESAVVGTVTGLIPKDGLAAGEIAAEANRVVEQIRSIAFEVSGSSDWGSLAGLFRSAAHRFADRTAVVDLDGANLSYRELDERSDRLAAGLIASGAGPEVLIGVAMPRTAELIVALLGVIKSGAAYLPLDRSHPLERLQTIVDDARPLLVLADDETIATWQDLDAVLSTVADASGEHDDDVLPHRVDGAHPAYVMYTSGSTGKPKGVVVTHDDVVTLLRTMGGLYDLSSTDVWSMFQSYAFDVSVGEIWAALSFGGRLVVLDYFTTRSPADFVEVLEREQVTVVHLTPSAFYQLAAAVRPPAGDRLAQSIRYMIFAGEALDFGQVRRWHEDRLEIDGNPGPALNNMYGPTEATVYVTRRELGVDFVARTVASDIGAPIENSRAYVLDQRLARVPEGVAGELYLAGPQLTRGYLGRFDLTATRFVADPFEPGARMYRTGDVVIPRGDGLEYVGRSDAQVKLRGYRIELGEVEAALLAAPGVNAAAAAIRQRDGQPEQMVGYVVGNAPGGGDLDENGIRATVGARVPDYMVPDVVMILDQLPLNVNGKLDRKALPVPAPKSSAVYVPPRDESERQIATVFESVLDVDRVSVVESLFGIGGNSLVAAQIAARCKDDLDLVVSVRDIFEAPTVRDLAARVAGRKHVHRPELVAAARPSPIPLSYAQRRIWFLDALDPGSHVYNIPLVLRFRGDLDPSALDAAVRDLLGRHEILRTRFPSTDGVPEQIVLAVGSYQPDLDITSPARIPADDGAVDAALAEVTGVGFDLESAPPIRARQFRAGDDEFVFALVAHHVISDGGSLTPLAQDLVALYAARRGAGGADRPQLEVQYADYTLWQRHVLGDPESSDSLAAQQLAFWRHELDGAPEVIALPTDRPRPPVQSNRADAVTFEVDGELFAAVRQFAQSHNASLFMVLHAAWALVLHRLTGDRDVVVGTPYAGRGERGLDHLVGMFMNTVVLRTPVDPSQAFGALLDDVRDRDLAALGNADIPFDMIVEQLQPTRSTAHSPIFQVLLLLQDAQGARFELPGVTAELVEQYRDLTDHDLAITFIEGVGGDGVLSGVIEYATDLFDGDTVGEFIALFERTIRQVVFEPDRPMGDLEVLDADDLRRRRALAAGETVRVRAETIADAVARQAAATPDLPALVSDDRTLTYGEFMSRVTVLARELIGRGVGPDVAVGVSIPRSTEMVVAIHAVVAAGGRYVPIDVAAPVDRIRYMLDTAGAEIVLVGPGGSPSAVVESGAAIVTVECDSVIVGDDRPLADDERRGRLRPDHAAYTIFTSGSTGRPKGVTVPHDAVVNRMRWGLDELPIDASDTVVLKTPVTFDCSVAELFAPLMVGARLLVLDADGHLDPVYVAEQIARHRATMVHFVPSMLSVFLEVAGPERVGSLDSLRIVSTTGEALPPAVAAQTRNLLPDVLFYNLYGPTEAAVEITYQRIDDVDASLGSVPIGEPVWNSTAHVLDARLHPVPRGAAGELYVGGVQLARGYAARPDLTAERFVADPFGAPGARLYRTGDLVRHRRDGSLDYLGRTDFQIKLRGQRIELGEIESVLAAAPGVVHAAATVATAPAGGDHLVAYLAGSDEHPIDLDRVKSVIAEALAEYMRPTVWMVLDDIPLNSAGKLDRRALPEPEFTAGEYVAPESDAEATVADVFADVLGVDRVSVVDSFFDLGGNSLSATRVAARVADALGSDVPVRSLFDAPTARELAELVSGARVRRTDLPALGSVAGSQPRTQPLPLSFAQQRMWFINQFDPASPAYNIPVLLRLRGPVDSDAMGRAFADVVARHEVLRTRYPAGPDGTPYQEIADTDTAAPQLDWAVGDEAQARELLVRGFDVAGELPIRARLAAVGPDEHLLVVVVHHIAADGESGPVLARDLAIAYTARAQGDSPSWPPMALQYADYAIWQRRALGDERDPGSEISRQLGHWRTQLAGLPDVLELPTDHPRPAVSSMRSGSVGYRVDEDIRRGLDELARVHGTTRFMVVHAALAVLLARLSATSDIAVATPVAGRGDVALDDLVGMFVNTLVLRTEVTPHQSFSELLGQARRVDLDAFSHADVPFERVVEALDPVRSESFEPLAQVLLVLDQSGLGPRTVGDLEIIAEDPGADAAKFDLTVGLTETADGALAGKIIYATDLFDAAGAERIAAAFHSLLIEIAASSAAGADPAVGDLAILDEAETAQRVDDATGERVDLPAQALPEALTEFGAGHPGAPALLVDDRVIDHAEFAARVNTLARELIALGVGPDVAVALCIPRSAEMVIAIHAVVTAGGQYVPIDTEAPPERAGYIIDTAGATLLLVAPGDRPSPVADNGTRVVEVDATTPIDSEAPEAQPVSDADRTAPLWPDHAAYTIFTSGSTGRPKGVTVSHRSVLNRLRWGLATFPFGTDDTVILKTPYTFDVSVPELFAPVIAGARMLVARHGGHTDPTYLADVLHAHQVTSVHFVPSMLAVFLDVVPDRQLARLTRLRYIFCSGEALSPSVAAATRDTFPHAGLHDLFGPTEAAVEVAHQQLDTVGDVVPIGRPTWNTRTIVLDARLRVVPVGVPGELYLGGVQVARGYATRSELTADRFVPDPYGMPGERLYRTGDLVRWNRDGALEYLGRTDFQVKLRGQRVELGEIESVLAGVPGVVHAATTVATAPGGAQHLVAYLAPASTVDVDTARRAVADALPQYMRPTVWTVLDELPLGSAGKLDRRALPQPDFGTSESAGTVEPGTDAERRIAEVIAGVLGVDRIGVTESFFALGGDSIMSIQVSSLLRGAGFPLSPRDIFEHKTVRDLARAVDGAAAELLDELPGGAAGDMALTPTVHWMLEHADGPSDFADYSQALVLTLPSEAGEAGLAAVLESVVEHHPVLSARLSQTADGWSMRAGEPFSGTDALAVWTAEESAERAGTGAANAVVRAAHADALSRLSPAEARMIAVTGIRGEGGGPGRLVVAVHHLAVDAVSWRTIVTDLAIAWSQHRSGDPITLPDNGTSMRRWAEVLHGLAVSRASELPIWKRHLPEHPTLLGAPLDRDRDRQSSVRSETFRVPAELTEAVLGRIAGAFRTGADDIMLAALGLAVARHHGGPVPVSMLLESHGREEHVGPAPADLSRAVGWFTSVSPVTLDIDPTAPVASLVKATKEAIAERPDDGIAFGALRHLRPDSPLSARPLPPITFNFLGGGAAGRRADAVGEGTDGDVAFAPAVDAPRLPGTVAGTMAALAQLAVNINTVPTDDGRILEAEFSAPSAVLDGDAIGALAAGFTEALAQIAAHVDEVGDPGLSPSDVAPTGLTQDEIDHLAVRYPGADLWSLTPLQRGLFYQAERTLAGDRGAASSGLDVYVTQGVIDIHGHVDADRLRESARRLLGDHRVLRSGYLRTGSGTPVAVVPTHVDLVWESVDLGELSAGEAERRADELTLADRITPFDLATPPLLRFRLIRLPRGVTRFVVTNHHLLLDGWSNPLVLAELFAHHGGLELPGTDETVSRDFGDFLRWLARRDDDAGLAAWRETLAEVDGPTLVRPGFSPTATELPRDATIATGTDLAARLTQLARDTDATVPTVLQYAWGVLLSRLTGRTTVTFGETVSGRPPELPGVETMIGLFINTLPVVVDVDAAQSVRAGLADLQATKARLLDHQHLGLADIASAAGHQELFDTLTVYESYPVDADAVTAGSAAAGLEIGQVSLTDATHYPLNLAAAPSGDDLELTFKYLPNAFSDNEISRIADMYRALLAGFVDAPGCAVGDIVLVDAGERAALAPMTTPARTTPQTIPEILAAREVPGHRTALILGDRSMTYDEFGDRTHRLGRLLIGEGIGPGDVVAVAIGRSVESVIAVWSVIATGAAYLPIDPALPTDRVAHMLADSGVAVALTTTVTRLDERFDGVGWIAVDDPDTQTRLAGLSGAAIADDERTRGPRLDDVAYLIYTSGSTGRPKAVAVSHRGVAEMIAAQATISGTASDTRVLHVASPSFDAAFFEMAWAIGLGVTLVVSPADVFGGPGLVDVMADGAVTDAVITPQVLATMTPHGLTSLRHLTTAGEACPPEVVEAWAPGREMFNLYGPSEATVWATSAVLMPGEAIAIGRPVGGFAVAVLDERLHPVPVGAVGELYLAGEALALGYLNRPGLSASTFVADPYGAPGSRLYRTGDLVRWTEHEHTGTHQLEFAGRADFQVKINGQRVELGEIDAVLAAQPGVDLAVTLGVSADGIGTRLVSYVVPDADSPVDLDPDALTDAVSGRLARYMVPSALIVLDALPLTTSGKLDRRALPAPQWDSTVEFVAPATPGEADIAEIIADLLDRDRVGATDSFFDLGGNSLSATRLAARISATTGTAVAVRDVFDHPTVRDLARVVSAAESDVRASVTPGSIARPEHLPLSYSQQRIWFINRFDPDSAAYNIPLVLELRGDLDRDALRAALFDVIGRHEVLRSTVVDGDDLDGGAPEQIIHPVGDLDAESVWAQVTGSPDEITAAVTAAVSTGFDISRVLPVRAVLGSDAGDARRHLLALVVHHIAADGESMRPLLADVLAAYRARIAGGAPHWAPLSVQFADYALWQRAVLGDPGDPGSAIATQTRYWTEKLASIPDVLELPADRPRPAVASLRGASADFEIPADVAASVTAIAADRGVTPFMVAHAALAVLLSRLSGTADIAVSTPIAGRGHAAFDELVGMFVNTLVLRTEIDTSTTFADLLDEVRRTDLDAYAHADVPFEYLVEKLNPVRSEAFAPLSQVLLTVDQNPSPQMDLPGLSIRPAMAATPATSGPLASLPAPATSGPLASLPAPAAKVDLTIDLATGSGPDDGWRGSIVYATDLFDEATIERFAAQFTSLIGDLARTPSTAVGDATLVTDREADQIRENSTGADVTLPGETLDTAIIEQARRTPGAPALGFEGRTVDYAEFAARVSSLARDLIRQGVGPDDAVGVCIPRSPEMVTAIHAVIAAGGQYVPIDTEAPAERVRHMLETADASFVLVGPGAAPTAILDAGATVLAVDTNVPVDMAIAPVTDADRRAPLHADHAAYTIFTSGSTGRPKGVTVSHRAVANRLRWGLSAFPLDASDTVILKTPYTFDVSVPELFAPLFAGARMLIARPGGHTDPGYLADVLEAERVTSVHFVPSMLSVFLDVVDHTALSRLTSLRYVFASGEALPPAVAKATRTALPWAGLHDLFGPTEAAVEVAHQELTAVGDVVPIGRPTWNTTTWVLDDRLRPAPVGVPGELYLGGVQIARGYAARADLTAERFVADPFGAPGDRLYRTGDLVRWNRAGELEYLGRTDFQVKLRGQRIELGEIEAVLTGVDEVVHAAVTVARSSTGAEHLVAYLVGPASAETASAAAAQALPEYMRPTAWVLLDAIPLGGSGKLDRRALPEPDFTALETGYEAPADDDERAIAGVFAGALGVDRISVTESFFALGGDSIMSIRVASALRAAGYTISPRDIFERRTVRALAVAARAEAVAELDEYPGGGAGEIALTPAIHWMLEHSDRPSDVADFSQSSVLVLPDGISGNDLRTVVAAVVAHHPMLSARLVEHDGEWELTAGNDFDADAAVEISDVDAPIGSPAFVEAVREGHAQALDRLDPGTGAVLAAHGLRSRDGGGRLVLAVHHLAVDAVSWSAIITDLVTAWAHHSAGQPISLQPTGTSMRRWAGVLTDLAGRDDELAMWADHLRSAPEQVGRPFDRARDRQSTVRTISWTLPAELSESLLTRVPDGYRTGADNPLLAALALAVADPATGDRVAILLEGHGREEGIAPGADLSRGVGWFTSIAPLSVDVPAGADVSSVVKSVKDSRAAMPDRGIAFGSLRYLRADSPLADLPLPAVSFNYFGNVAGPANATPSGDAAGDDAGGFLPAVGAPVLPRRCRARWLRCRRWRSTSRRSPQATAAPCEPT